ncbi:MAG: cytochrome C oxidase subunit IV family protein [Firmicutes bacterium]|nr:cytochrome C oxidase subunit IV family protein [Bacillota bacterium]
MQEKKHEDPTLPGESVEIPLLAPHLSTPHFPARQIAGYVASLILTGIAFFLVARHALPLSWLLAVVLILAFLQAAIQLGVFMHLREGRGTTWHLPIIGLGLFVGLGIVGFSIWIMLFKSGVS